MFDATSKSLALTLTRLRAKSGHQLARTILLEVWPFSLLTRNYYRFRYSQDRYKAANKQARSNFQMNSPKLNACQRDLVSELKTNGLACAHISELVDDISFTQLVDQANKLMENSETQQKIKLRHNKDNAKWYVVRALGSADSEIQIPNWLAELVLHPSLLDVVNSYLGFHSRLHYADLWLNFPVLENEPSIDSEHWHRDHEDLRVVKLFLYLDDVNEGGGPFTYMTNTHPDGMHFKLFPHTPPLGTYPPDKEVESQIPADCLRICTGKAGTFFLADTVGFHRGGRCTDNKRLLLTATYTSNLEIDPKHYVLGDTHCRETMNTAAQHALRLV